MQSMKKILVIDNYDSFTYNLVHYIEKLTGIRPDVYRNDEIDLESVNRYDKILLSPGPGIPSEAGICIDLVKRFASEKSILGICLGHQTIGEAFGASLLNLSQVYHGLATSIIIQHSSEPLFKGLPGKITGGRYHSWVVEKENLPDCLIITCEDENGMIMGITHKHFDVRGLQFHPESVLTEYGTEIIKNWLSL
jgi:anthranilate synthase component II